MLFDSMMALQLTETHNIALKNLALFRPKLRLKSTNQIARFANYYCYNGNYPEYQSQKIIKRKDKGGKALIPRVNVNGIEFSIRL